MHGINAPASELNSDIKKIDWFCFIYYLAVPRSTLGHHRGDSFTHLVLITACFSVFEPHITRSPARTSQKGSLVLIVPSKLKKIFPIKNLKRHYILLWSSREMKLFGGHLGFTLDFKLTFKEHHNHVLKK